MSGSSRIVPKHVSIIMDGNGRWAKAQGKPRSFGHLAGAKTAKEIIKRAHERGIKVLSLFAFSSENWERPKVEVSFLMELFQSVLTKELKSLHKNGVKLVFSGNTIALTKSLQKLIVEATDKTKDNNGLIVNVVVNYGGKWDIIQATKKIASEYKEGALDIDSLDEERFSQYLGTYPLPDPDLLIRTSGETRISNFFLWQHAYSELIFCDCHWPDFTVDSFDKALDVFSKRERRFGKVNHKDLAC